MFTACNTIHSVLNAFSCQCVSNCCLNIAYKSSKHYPQYNYFKRRTCNFFINCFYLKTPCKHGKLPVEWSLKLTST